MRLHIRFPGFLAMLCASLVSCEVTVLAGQASGVEAGLLQSAPVPVQQVPDDNGLGALRPGETRFAFGGDFRVRYESNFADADRRSHDRIVIRGRARAVFNAPKRLSVGVQVTTGDPDDPNSADITLSNFDDDLQISLDQLYARLQFRDLQVVAGKFPQPFIRTDLLWDADVSPQGLSATYTARLRRSNALRVTALYFVVDESLTGRNSDMGGLQVVWNFSGASTWKYELATGFYDYSLQSLVGSDAGDLRTNAVDAAGRYVSDFNLFNVVSTISYLGKRWPARITADYVKNFGAATSADGAYSADVVVGPQGMPKSWRYSYGYALANTDAVLAAFSHDNTTIATNYRQHSASVDYQLSTSVFLNTTLYRYRPIASAVLPDGWLNRLRLNLLISF